MKKLVTMIFALAVATSLSVPVFAKSQDKKEKPATASTEHSKGHMKHAKKKGSTEGKKAGQQSSTPAPKQ